MPLEEESERPLQADDEGQAWDKKNLHREQRVTVRSQVRSDHMGGDIPKENYWSTHISNGEESFVKKQHHPEEEEKHTKSRQPHPNLCRF